MKLRRQSQHHHESRQGFVLLAILVFIFLLSMLTVSLLFRSQGEETATAASSGSEQAWSAAMSGVEVALEIAKGATPGSFDWQDNPSLFRQRPVYEDGADQWYFTVYSPSGSDALVEVRYGLSDTAGRLNLNHPGRSDLAKVPRFTQAMLDSFHQYMNGSSSGGASSLLLSSTLEPGVEDSAPGFTLGAKTGARQLATLDELLMIQGFTGTLLHGEDANMNGRLDANEDDGDETYPPDNHDGRLDHGLAQYFTVESYDPNRSDAGTSRYNLNDPKAEWPAGDFPAGFSNYVASLRAAKQRVGGVADVLEAVAHLKNEQGIDVEIASGITKEELPRVMDLFTTDDEGRHDGLLNINTASATVLATLPDVDAALAETIVSTRTAISPERRGNIAWLYQEGVVDAARFKSLAPSLTARSYQFHFQVIGYGLPSGRYRVLEVAIDVAGAQSRVTYLRDITRLGLPFALKAENALPAGEGASLHRRRLPTLTRTHG
ncbi:MAG TPA: hypothetical protein VMF06_09620 [Candidatus Limnocylindria bacterium]|nr:hypothetical protein [Candidatus Limnocylindria bacterium]